MDGPPRFPCPVCEIGRDVLTIVAERNGFHACSCPICGRFEINQPAIFLLGSWPKPTWVPGEKNPKERLRAGLSAFVRQRNKSGMTPQLTEHSKLAEIADSYCHTSVAAKLPRVLERFEELTSRPGEWILLDYDHDYPLFDAADAGEALYLTQTLASQGLLEYDRGDRTSRITANGWNALMPSAGGGAPGSCFVAMSFDSALDDAYADGILPALTTCGFPSIRLDRVEHTDNINDKILADIRGSQFVLADFTGHKSGVYFEAGFALGLGKTVIWTCREDDSERAHFDTRPYNHILWKGPTDLRDKLTNRIRAVIPNAKIV